MFLYFWRHLSQCGGTRQSGVRRPRQNKLDTDENPKDAQSKKTAPSPGAIHKKNLNINSGVSRYKLSPNDISNLHSFKDAEQIATSY